MKALVLAGGVPQIALIENLKRRGILTVLCDYYENPVAKAYADVFYRVSTLDVEGIEKVAKDEDVDFLITVCTDQALLTVSKVSEVLGLPCYIDYQTALHVTNKAYMKEVFVKSSIPTAKYVTQAELDMDEMKDMRYPLIVKPADCNSSKGVVKVENEVELKMAFSQAIKMSRTSTAVIEEFVAGKELSVDAFVENGVAHILCISELFKIPDNDKFVIFRTMCPASIDEKVYSQIGDVVQKIADAFGLNNSPMLIQLICDREQIYVLEFSARTGGGEKFKLIKQMTNFDVVDAVVNLTLGKVPYVSLAKNNRYYVTEFVYCKAGRFDKLVGFDELQEQDIIEEYFQFKWKGAEFANITNSGDRVAGFMICAYWEEELKENHVMAVKKIRVQDVNGIDMIKRDILNIKF